MRCLGSSTNVCRVASQYELLEHFNHKPVIIRNAAEYIGGNEKNVLLYITKWKK